jgi:hypothetical protein
MSDTPGDQAVGIFAGKLPGIGLGVRMRRPIGLALQADGGRDRDDGKFGQRRQTEPPALIMGHNGDMVGVVEAGGAALEGGVVELPFR